jgi:pimeloyl-ACP methyl ester carboxylesterase
MDTAIATRRNGLESLDVRGFTAAYHQGGAGPPVIAAHCSSASHKALRPLIQQLEQRYEVFAPDLIGYGASDRWPADRPLEPETEIALITELAAQADAPVHLVGHSYGAMLSLEAARQLGAKAASLTLIEPVSFHLLKPGGRGAEHAQLARIAAEVRAAMDAGKPKRAASHYMGFWMGRWRWWLAPARLRQGVLSTIDKVAKEFALLERMEGELADYRGIEPPTRLIMGGRTRAPAKAVIDILMRTLPNAELRTVRRAGHMSPLTHPEQVTPLVLGHLARHAQG